jgi:hypothetical protein
MFAATVTVVGVTVSKPGEAKKLVMLKSPATAAVLSAKSEAYLRQSVAAWLKNARPHVFAIEVRWYVKGAPFAPPETFSRSAKV